jgi:hypothetical protein
VKHIPVLNRGFSPVLDFQKLCRWYIAYCGVVRMFLFLLLGSMMAIGLSCQVEGSRINLCIWPDYVKDALN